MEELLKRIQNALDRAQNSGGVDGEHHKMWVIDQMVRELTGCPIIKGHAIDYKGRPFIYSTLGSSEEYKNWVKETQFGDDGPNTYEWETGIAP